MTMKRRELLGVLGAAGLAGAVEREAVADHDAGTTKDPADAFHLYLCAFHLAKKDPSFVVEAHHYCSPVADEVHQCIIYDARGKNAKILGVEYIISDALYRKLPAEEKKYYHPHSYEVLSGQLVAPKLGPEEEDKLLGGLITTWGKTWHTWPDPKTPLPMGDPLLMWAFTEDGQIDPALIEARDAKLKMSTAAVRRRRGAAGLGKKA